MNKEIFINEGAGPLSGLPKHWIQYLTQRYGKGYGGNDMAGEKSIITPIKRFDGGYVKKALKDKNNIAVIGKTDGEPLFMIASHDNYQTKYRIFEVTKSEGTYNAKGTSFRKGGRRGRYVTRDAYTIGEIVDIIDKMFGDKDASNLTVEAISIDPERAGKIKSRREEKNPIDPLYQDAKPTYGDAAPNLAQKQRANKWADKKRPLLDAKMDAEVKKMKEKINSVLDTALDKAMIDVKKGRSYSINKETLGKAILAQVDLTPILNLSQAYSTLGNEYTSDPVYKRAKTLKQSGLIP